VYPITEYTLSRYCGDMDSEPILRAISRVGALSTCLKGDHPDPDRDEALVVAWAVVSKRDAEMMYAEMASLVRRYDPEAEVVVPEKIQ